MLSSFRRVPYTASPVLRKRGYPIYQVTFRTFARGARDKDPRDKEPIIVEIIDNTDKHKDKKTAENRTWTPPEENKYKPPSFSGSVFNLAKSVVKRVSNTFFPDEQTRIKNELKDKVNQQIDASFKGGGILGSIMKQGIKMVSNQVVSTMVEVEQVKQKLQVELDDILNRDPTAKRLLGLPVELSDILEMQAVASDDGRSRSMSQQITYQVVGSHASGIVRARVDKTSEALLVKQVLVTIDHTNQMFEAELTPKPDKSHIIDV